MVFLHYSYLRFGDFNSIKVRLELAVAASLVVGRPFQFHKGTIRTKIYNDFYRNDTISIP